MSKTQATPLSDPAPVKSTSSFVSIAIRVPLKSIATGSNGPARSQWIRPRAHTEHMGFTGVRALPPAQASDPTPIPVRARSAQTPPGIGSARGDTLRRPHAPIQPEAPPPHVGSESTTSSDEEQVDLLAALAGLSAELVAPPNSPRDEPMSFREALQMPPPPESSDETALAPARQRDLLLHAIKHGNSEQASSLLEELSSTDHLERQFPAPIPDRFMEHIWKPAQGHLSTFRIPIQTYVVHCRQIAVWHHWVRDVLRQRTEMMHAVFSPGLWAICDALRTTHEVQLKENANTIAHRIATALADPQLAQALAEQPFTNIQTMLDKCTILETHLKDTASLKAFRSAVEIALSEQLQATRQLRAALLSDSPPATDALKRLWRKAFAHQVTSAPDERLGDPLSEPQRKTLLAQLMVQRKNQASTPDDGWDFLILNRLCLQAERSVKQKSGRPIATQPTQDGSDDDVS
ncbi:hypothetical protein [Hydrogenophaga sp. BPS33]|uniref:hypothetical protein n=1 Tax=Hydrogenophaga sp. BPS33 TaxID=2651974 RepID=UPI0013202325|nr:hypothetical protein [Hydrogenophaga sp. BPS33]QHE84417.1 hypothetical protein F9K07_05705 [Hydrogenophaga sp. BPS33]